MYKTILLCYDGSVEGRQALRQGAEVALSAQAATHLLAVVPPMPNIAAVEGVFSADPFELDEEAYRQILEDGVAILKENGLEARGHLAYGDPVDQIARHAKTVGADLIVVGHRNRTRLERWWTGSVSKSLLDHTDCSLLISVFLPPKDPPAD